MKITFKQFHSSLLDLGYSRAEIRHLYKAVKNMDPQSRHWVIRWFFANELPDVEIEGGTAGDLVSKGGYQPLNALIVLDWLKTDPQTAKYFLLKSPGTVSPSDSIGPEVERLLKREGYSPSEPYADIDQSDIQDM